MKTKQIIIGICILFNVSYGQLSLAQSLSVKLDENSQNQSHQVVFTENKGQVSDQFNNSRPDVLFSGQTGGMAYHLRENGVSYQLSRIDSWREEESINKKERDDVKRQIPDEITIYRTDMNWIGTNDDFTVEYGEVLPSYTNYYLAVCPEGATHVRSYKSITYKNIYDGIDLRWYDNNGELEYDFVVAPGADYSQIKWKIKGASELYLSEAGELLISTPLGKIIEEAPKVFQGSVVLQSSWQISGDEVSFLIENAESQLAMVIDPVVRLWATYYGGTGYENINFSITDGSNVYLAGHTFSSSAISTTGAHQTTRSGVSDAFLVKFNSNGVRQWATYYGGNDVDHAYSCATDGSNIYLTGGAHSTSAISTFGAHQTTYGGGNEDAFLVKFNSSGIRQWATYYGGNRNDAGYSCTTNGSAIYMSGKTRSTSNISTIGAHQATLASSSDDAFLVKFNSNGVRQWATYYGGWSGSEIGFSCATDGSNVYMAGRTQSPSAISSLGAHQTTFSGGSTDAFLVKFNSSGVRQWGTYYGGKRDDDGYSCTTDGSNVFLAGYTLSDSAISTTGAHQPTFGGGSDGFLVKFNSSGVRQWATYYGGMRRDDAYSCATDGSNIYLAGGTGSTSAISTSDAHQVIHGGGSGDAYLVKFNNNGVRQWATYYGGSGQDRGHSCATDGSNVFLAGFTLSDSAISTIGSHQTTFSGGSEEDGFLVKFSDCINRDTIFPTVCDSSYISPSGKYAWTNSGTYIDTLINSAGCDSILTVQLTIHHAPPVVFLGNDTTICFGDIITLDAGSDGDTYLWQNASTGQTNMVNTAGKYWVKVENKCGITYDTLIVSIRHAPNVFLGNDTTLCLDETLTLDAWTDDATYVWQDGSTGRYYTVRYQGEYWVEVTNVCSQDNDSILAFYIEKPIIDLGNDTSISCPDWLILDVTSEQAKYLWNDGRNDSIRTIKGSGDYTVIVSNICGEDRDDITVEVKDCPCELYIPNSFTPNGDGINDAFGIGLACEVVKFNIIILNRWGDIIYESHEENFEWNGFSKSGGQVPQDTYVYKIKLAYKGKTGISTSEKLGNLIVIR